MADRNVPHDNPSQHRPMGEDASLKYDTDTAHVISKMLVDILPEGYLVALQKDVSKVLPQATHAHVSGKDTIGTDIGTGLTRTETDNHNKDQSNMSDDGVAPTVLRDTTLQTAAEKDTEKDKAESVGDDIAAARAKLDMAFVHKEKANRLKNDHKQYKQAAEEMSRSLAILNTVHIRDPERPDQQDLTKALLLSHYGRGECYERMSPPHPLGALYDFCRSVQLNKHSFRTYKALANIAARMGNYKEAVEALKMALSLAQAEAEMKASKACSKTPTVEPAPIKTFTSTAKTATAMSQTKPGTMVDKATQTISRDAQTDTESGSKVRMVDMATQTEPMQSESGAKAKQGAKAKKSKKRPGDGMLVVVPEQTVVGGLQKALNTIARHQSRAQATPAWLRKALRSGDTDRVRMALKGITVMHNMSPYSQPLTCLRAVCLIALGQHQSALQLLTKFEYEVPAAIKGAPWRYWLAMLAHYEAGDIKAALASGAEFVKACQRVEGLNAAARAEENLVVAAFGGDPELVLKEVGLALPTATAVASGVFKLPYKLSVLKEADTAIKTAGESDARLYQTAIEKYNTAVELGLPAVLTAKAYCSLAQAHLATGSYLHTIAASIKAIALDPSLVKPYTYLTQALVSVGMRATAFKQLQRLHAMCTGEDRTMTLSTEEATGLRSLLQTLVLTEGGALCDDIRPHAVLGLEEGCTEDEVVKVCAWAETTFMPSQLRAECLKTLSCLFGPITTQDPTQGKPWELVVGAKEGITERLTERVELLTRIVKEAKQALAKERAEAGGLVE